MSSAQHIGFIGLGVMGASMAGHLLSAGHRLSIYTRSKAKAEALLSAGAEWCANPAAVAQAADAIITIVGFPQDVEEVYFGNDQHSGIIANAKAGSHLIDMTTSQPQLAVKIYEAAKTRGIASLDAPVSGGDLGAKEARLSIMAGGDETAFENMLPLLKCMGKNIVHQGPAGSGQHCKMANQIAIASGMIGVCEAMAYAKKSGLDAETVLSSISGGAAGSWALSNLAPRMIANDFGPGFFIKHFIKDMGIAQTSSQDINLDTPGLNLAKELYDTLAANGHENDGTQALFRQYLEEPQ